MNNPKRAYAHIDTLISKECNQYPDGGMYSSRRIRNLRDGFIVKKYTRLPDSRRIEHHAIERNERAILYSPDHNFCVQAAKYEDNSYQFLQGEELLEDLLKISS